MFSIYMNIETEGENMQSSTVIETAKAAEFLGISTTQIKRLLKTRVLEGVKIWRAGSIKPVWQIDTVSIEQYKKNRRPRGRPVKQRFLLSKSKSSS